MNAGNIHFALQWFWGTLLTTAWRQYKQWLKSMNCLTFESGDGTETIAVKETYVLLYYNKAEIYNISTPISNIKLLTYM